MQFLWNDDARMQMDAALFLKCYDTFIEAVLFHFPPLSREYSVCIQELENLSIFTAFYAVGYTGEDFQRSLRLPLFCSLFCAH